MNPFKMPQIVIQPLFGMGLKRHFRELMTQEGDCYICRQPTTKQNALFTLEHVISINERQKTKDTEVRSLLHPSNSSGMFWAASCLDCNTQKSNTPIKAFFKNNPNSISGLSHQRDIVLNHPNLIEEEPRFMDIAEDLNLLVCLGNRMTKQLPKTGWVA